VGLGLGSAASSPAQTVKITADNNYAVYTGTASTVTPQFTGLWTQGIKTANITPGVGENFLYIAAWDDGNTFQGLLATVSAGIGYVTTGSNLWRVCATNTPVTTAPTPANLAARIVACNKSSGWRPTSNGPADGNAGLSPFFLWGNQAIDDSAAWIWHDNPKAPCPNTGNPPFLQGSCDPGEYLIFRISLKSVAQCPEPVPNFTINWTAGYGVLVANGTNSQHEQNYFWSIQESNQWWGSQGPEIMQWFPGQAGAFDLKSFFESKGQRLKCDTYYRVKLAVGNQCVGWRDTIRLVKLKCCPGEVISLPRP
jgi:hypothetical protein